MFHDQRETPLVQFKPARAKKKAEVDELSGLSTTLLYDEQKIDGERYLVQTGRPTRDNKYQHGITSRRESVQTGRFVEKTDRVPHIANAPLPAMSIFDSEFVSSGDLLLIDFPGKLWDKLMEPNHPHMTWLKAKFGGALPIYPHVGNTVSIMGSLGPEAVRKQEERGLIWSYMFDLIQYLGKNATSTSQFSRRQLLARVLESIDPESGIVLMPAWQNLTVDERTEFFYLVTDPVPVSKGGNGIDGGEGLILKAYDKPYNHAHNWWKVKKDFPADCVLTGGFTWGNEGKTGKMVGRVGALEIGVYLKGELVPIGYMSAIMDSEAKLDALTDDAVAGRLRGVVAECRHNGLQPDPGAPTGHTLRHPRWRRWREDKNPEDCTFEVLLAEVKRIGNA